MQVAEPGAAWHSRRINDEGPAAGGAYSALCQSICKGNIVSRVVIRAKGFGHNSIKPSFLVNTL
jgi:hypothetical protein